MNWDLVHKCKCWKFRSLCDGPGNHKGVKMGRPNISYIEQLDAQNMVQAHWTFIPPFTHSIGHFISCFMWQELESIFTTMCLFELMNLYLQEH